MRTWPAISLRFPAAEAAPPAAGGLQDLVSATLDGLDVLAIAEPAEGIWQVCFRSEEDRASAEAALRAAHGRAGLGIDAIDLPDEDWARRSQAALGAVRVGRLVIAPPWAVQAAAPERDTITIVIDPAMGFGSGHHPTTRLCLAALQRLDLHGRHVLDIGTGSGVLALAAARLGAASVLAIDVDADALENARGNAGLNACPPGVEFQERDFRDGETLAAEIVVANLTGGMLMAIAGRLVRAVRPAGTLILSGVTAEERERTMSAFSAWGRVEWEEEEDGWLCMLLCRE
jgi:ribosomal protein L11 methyltransferase